MTNSDATTLTWNSTCWSKNTNLKSGLPSTTLAQAAWTFAFASVKGLYSTKSTNWEKSTQSAQAIQKSWSINQNIRSMGSRSMSKIPTSCLTTLLMKTKTVKICTSTRSVIFFRACTKGASWLALLTARLAQAKLSQWARSQSTRSTIFSNLRRGKKKSSFSCLSLKFTVESAWICSTIKSSCKFWRIKTTKFKFLGSKKRKRSQQAMSSRS